MPKADTDWEIYEPGMFTRIRINGQRPQSPCMRRRVNGRYEFRPCTADEQMEYEERRAW